MTSSRPLLYFPKLGTEVVDLAVPPLRWKGLSNEEEGLASSARPRVCSVGVPALGKARDAAEGRVLDNVLLVQFRTTGAAVRVRGAIVSALIRLTLGLWRRGE